MKWRWLYGLFTFVLFLPLFNLLLGIHPPKPETDDNPGRYGLAYESVSFQTSDGLTLRGWFIPAVSTAPQKVCATILVGHGYPFDKANILRHALFLHNRFHLLLFDFRYFGESDGAYTTAGVLETRDFHAAVEYTKSRNDVMSARIGAMGYSMSASVFILTAHPQVRAIVADSPYATLEGVIAGQFSFLPGLTKWPFVALTKLYARIFPGTNVEDGAPAEAVDTLKSRLLIIHGDADSQIPLEHSQAIYANANPDRTELWIVRGANHGLAHAHEGRRYESRVLRFFEQYLCPKDAVPA